MRLLGSVVLLLRGAREAKKKKDQSKPPHGSSFLRREAELRRGRRNQGEEELWRLGLLRGWVRRRE